MLIDVNQDRHFGYFETKVDIEDAEHFVKRKADDKQFSIFIDSLEPLKVVGGGNIALDSVKKIDGDKAYIEYATKHNICTADDNRNNCSANFFMNSLKNECQCVPYELQGFSKV